MGRLPLGGHRRALAAGRGRGHRDLHLPARDHREPARPALRRRGEDFRDNTYVKISKTIVQQPGGVAYCVFDQQARRDPGWEAGIRTISPPFEASTLETLARAVDVPVEAFAATVRDYKAAVDRRAPFEPDRRDGKARGISPPKSNWALPIEEPPFLAFAVTGGITFPFGGLKTDTRARVLDGRGRPIPGLYAAGELQGEFYYDNYPGATSVLRGCIFGKIAGHDAAGAAISGFEN